MASPYPTDSIIMTEVFDATICRNLAKHDGVSFEDRKQLSRYRKQATNGNHFRVVYSFSDNWQDMRIGRLTPKPHIGLTAFPRVIRAALACKHYWDVDMVNAQPVLLLHLARQYGLSVPGLDHYVANRDVILTELMQQGITRDEAKDLCIATLFGGHRFQHPILPVMTKDLTRLANEVITDEKYVKVYKRAQALIKKEKKNPVFSTLSVVVQDFERRVFFCANNFLSAQGRALDTYEYDGGMLRRLEGEDTPPVSLLPGLEAAVEAEMGVRISFSFKPLSHSFTFDDTEGGLIPKDIVINDKYAATTFCTLMDDRIRRVGSSVYVQDSNGRWSNDDFELRSSIIQHEKQLIFKQEGGAGICTFDYGGDMRNIGKLYEALPYVTPTGAVPIQYEFQFVTTPPNLDAIPIFEDLIRRCCNNKDEIYNYVIRYIAHMLQKPFKNPGKCLLFSGRKGCGKDTPFDFLIRWVIGPMLSFNYNKTETLFKDHDTGRMNKVLVKIEEMKRSVCVEYADELKSFITGRTQEFNPKNKPICSVPNLTRFIGTFNGPNPVDQSQGERRFLISNCDTSKVGDIPYWTMVNNVLMTAEAGRAVGEWLISMSLDGYDVMDVPISEYQAAIVITEVRPEESWADQWEEGDWKTSSELFSIYKAYCIANSFPHCLNAVSFGRLLMGLFRDGKVRLRTLHGKSLYSSINQST